MKIHRSVSLLCFGLTVAQFFFVLTAIEKPAYGYVDPGSGILLMQFLGSFMTGGIFILRKRLKTLFVRTKSSQDATQKGETAS